MKTQEKPVGLTKDSGWQFGLRKTFPYTQEYLWDLIFSDKGLKIWLGSLGDELDLKKSFKTKEGIEGYVRVFTPYSHIRMDWKKKSWKDFSIVQVRIMGNEEKSTLSFHQEKLLNSDQREEMKVYWNKKMDEIEDLIRAEKKHLIMEKVIKPKVRPIASGNNLVAKQMQAEAGDLLPKHLADVESILFVHEGECILNINDEEIVLKQGEGYAIPPDTKHQIKAITDFKGCTVCRNQSNFSIFNPLAQICWVI